MTETLMNENSAFFSKPEIPTYLVGSEEALHKFSSHIPYPHETYTKLFLLGDSKIIDASFKKLLEDRKSSQRAEKLGAIA